jgi:hypothetical protein
MACTTISALLLLGMLGIFAVGALRSPAKANPPSKREEAAAETALQSPKIA